MRWLTPARTAVILLILTLIAGAGNLAASFAEVHHANAVQQQQETAQQRQGRMIEAKLCSTLGKLAALKPPPGDPETNPSRAFDQSEHAVLVQIGTDLGCRAG